MRIPPAGMLVAALLAPAPAGASGIDLGMRMDATLFELEMGPGVLPGGQLELGYVPDLLDGRIRVSLLWGMAGVAISQSGEDERLYNPKGDPAAEYSGRVALHSIHLGLEVGVRLLPSRARASPYIVWRPRLMFIRTISDFEVGEMDLPRVQEWAWYLTAEGGLGLEVRIGQGRLFTDLCVGLFPLANETIGSVVSLSLTASVGYRYVF